MRAAVTIADLELAAHLATPPAEEVDLDGWLLRFDPLGFLRFSSIWPREATAPRNGPEEISERLDQAVEHYARRGLAARLVLSPTAQPSGLSAELERTGWTQYVTAEVLTLAEFDDVTCEHGIVKLSSQPDDEWLQAWCRADSRVAAQQTEAHQHLSRVQLPTVYVSAGTPAIAIGRGIITSAGTAVLGMWVHPDHRRLGHAGRLLAAINRWGIEGGSPSMWLQVESTNDAARRLYRTLGFEFSYAYTGWVEPSGVTAPGC